MSELIATRIFEVLDDLTLGDKEPIDLNDLLNPQQKYELTYAIVRSLPKNDLEQVQQFHEAFKVDKENTHNVYDFKYATLRLSLILEEAMELGKALGFSNDDLYRTIISIFSKVKDKNIEPGIVEVGDALGDLRVVVNGTTDVFNLGDINQSLMEEVTSSNMSKLVPSDHPDVLKIVVETKKSYDEKGIEVISEDLKNGYIAIKNKETGKILKPITYQQPDLTSIINKHFND